MTAIAKITAKIGSLSTDQLLAIAEQSNLICADDAIMICDLIEKELMQRLAHKQFMAHMMAMENMLDAAI